MDPDKERGKIKTIIPPTPSRGLEDPQVVPTSKIVALEREIAQLKEKEGLTPKNIEDYFRRNLLKISALAEVPELLEKLLVSSTTTLADKQASADDKQSAAHVIGLVVSDPFSKVPMDLRLRLIRQVPDGPYLKSVVKYFLSSGTFYHPIPKTSNADRTCANWGAQISEIPIADFERMMRALPDAIPRLLLATHSPSDFPEPQRISSEQMHALCKITGNGKFKMCAVISREEHTSFLSSTDALQESPFAIVAFGSKEKIPLRFKRDVAILSSNLSLPTKECCRLLSSYGEENGPAAVLALWLSMRPLNINNRVVQAVVHHYLSKLTEKEYAAQLNAIFNTRKGPGHFKEGPDRKIFENTTAQASFIPTAPVQDYAGKLPADKELAELRAEDIDKLMFDLHAIFNPTAASRDFTKNLADQNERAELTARTVVSNILAIEDPKAFTVNIPEDVAKSLLSTTSLPELGNQLFEKKQLGLIPEDIFPQVALESLTFLFERQAFVISQILAWPFNQGEPANIPKGFGFPSVDDLTAFLKETGSEVSAQNDLKLKSAYLQLALTTSVPEMPYEARCWPAYALKGIELLNISDLLTSTESGQTLIGRLAGHAVIFGDLELAKSCLVYRSNNQNLSAIVQSCFAPSIPRILDNEIYTKGTTAVHKAAANTLKTYQDLGFEITPEDRKRAIVRWLKIHIPNSSSVRDRADEAEQLKSFASRFDVDRKVLLSELDRIANKRNLSANRYPELMRLVQDLGLEDIATHGLTITTRKPEFKKYAQEGITSYLSDTNTPLIIKNPLPENWESMPLKERVKLITPELAEIINHCGISEQSFQNIAHQAYRTVAERGGVSIDRGRNSPETASKIEAHANRMKDLALLFNLPESITNKIKREITLQKLPKPNSDVIQSVLITLKNPFSPNSLDKHSTLDDCRLNIRGITLTILEDIDVCARYDMPQIPLNNKAEVLTAIGLLACAITDRILDYDSNQNISDFLTNELTPRALSKLGLKNEHIVRSVEYALIMAKKAIENEKDPATSGHLTDIPIIQKRIAVLQRQFSLSTSTKTFEALEDDFRE